MRRRSLSDRVRLRTCGTPAGAPWKSPRAKTSAPFRPRRKRVRLLEILGEAARGVSEDLKSLQPEIPWREIVATRNLLIHEYFGVDMGVVAAILEQDLPSLLERLEAILQTMDHSGP